MAGLEHSVAWRPRGDLIGGTQRFGEGGLGQGRDGRHDVVFFEKNGLRHGEFGLQNAGQLNRVNGNGMTESWGYKVRELSWSSDSNVLAVWIGRDEGDVGAPLFCIILKSSINSFTNSSTMDYWELPLVCPTFRR